MASSSYRSHLPPPPLSFSSSGEALPPSPPPPPLSHHHHHHHHQHLDLDMTIVSAKHLKNVNWRNGELKPYVVFWVDPERKLATKTDDCGSTSPVWNERFTLPLNSSSPSLYYYDDLGGNNRQVPGGGGEDSLDSLVLTLEIYHSKPSETPKTLVASLRCPVKDLLLLLLPPHDRHPHQRITTLELLRPSGRPQGKIKLKLSLRERPLPPPPAPTPDYNNIIAPPPPAYYYSNAPPPPLPPSTSSRDYHRDGGVGGGFPPSPYGNPLITHSSHSPYAASYGDPYSGYYPSYCSPPPPPPPRPFLGRASGYGCSGGPSAPVDLSVPSASFYEPKPKGSMMGYGLAVGAISGAMGGLALEEGLKYEEEKITERVEERDMASRDSYSDYRAEY